MKRILVFLALAGFAGAALAQSAGTTPAPGGSRGWHRDVMPMRMQHLRMQHFEQWRLHQLTVLLDLSSAQQQQVKAILDQQHAAMRQSMQEMMRAVREMRRAHRAAEREMMTKMAHVLSAEQMTKFKVPMPPHPWGHRWGMSGPHGMMRGMGMGPPPEPPAAPQPPAVPQPPEG